ncbi:hypothetical protein MM716_34390, partial [Klebsiella pneumoniae]|nr:hypothetical protein [Klebsiella pneumoniae]
MLETDVGNQSESSYFIAFPRVDTVCRRKRTFSFRETASDGIVSTRRKPMKAFTKITAIVAPLDRSNVDTDAIIPKQFLKSIKRSGFGPNAFDEWRYLDHGEPGMD